MALVWDNIKIKVWSGVVGLWYSHHCILKGLRGDIALNFGLGKFNFDSIRSQEPPLSLVGILLLWLLFNSSNPREEPFSFSVSSIYLLFPLPLWFERHTWVKGVHVKIWWEVLLNWKRHYLSLQTWHSPIFYDVWILRFCWVWYLKKDCLKRDLPFQLILFNEREIQTL